MDRYMADLLFAEAQFLRPGGPLPARAAFTAGSPLDEDGLGFDSMERLALAAALGEALFLHRGGLGGALVAGSCLGAWRVAVQAALDRFSATVCFRTSGSTGMRRPCVHDAERLHAEARFFSSLLGDRQRVVVAVPSHHIYGFLFTLLLPAQLGIPVLDVQGRFPSDVLAMLQAGDLVIGHPVFWAALCRAASHGWPGGVTGVTSGAACPDAVAEAVGQAGLSRLLQVYGATETAGIGWRDAPQAPYRLLPWWRVTDDGAGLRRGATPGVEPPDRLCWLGPDRFTIEGRRDAAVQVGGVNVYPEHVRAVLRAHPAVADAAVRLMAPHEGSRLKAFVVPHAAAAPGDALRHELAGHTERLLSTAERPRAFSFGAALPQTAGGKPADWALSPE